MNVAVLGYGTVGSGVVEVIGLNQEKLARQIGEALNIKYVLDPYRRYCFCACKGAYDEWLFPEFFNECIFRQDRNIQFMRFFILPTRAFQSQQPCGCPRCGAWQGCWSWP